MRGSTSSVGLRATGKKLPDEEAIACGKRLLELGKECGLDSKRQLFDLIDGRNLDGVEISSEKFYKIWTGERSKGWRSVAEHIVKLLADLQSSRGGAERAAVRDSLFADYMARIFPAKLIHSNQFIPYAWAEALLAWVESGVSTWVSALPGNGANHVLPLLKSRFQDTDLVIRSINLGALAQDETLAEALSKELGGQPDRNIHSVARALAGTGRLLLVITGVGAHDRRYGAASLSRVLAEVQSFESVPTTRIIVTLLSPLPVRHWVTGGGGGSFSLLQPVFPGRNDPAALHAWAMKTLPDRRQNELDDLVGKSCGQLDALRAAIYAQGPERDRAIQEAHRVAADGILDAVCQACVEILEKGTGSSKCVKALREAGILASTSTEPVVGEWRNVWRQEEPGT